MGRANNRKGLSRTGRIVIITVVLFAMLCGLVLVAASSLPSPAEEPPVEVSHTERALLHLDKAAHALDANNYGHTREELHLARKILINLLSQEQAHRERLGGETNNQDRGNHGRSEIQQD